MPLKVEIDYEAADAIVLASLKDVLETLEKDLANRTPGSLGIFERDYEEDVKILKKHIKAFKRVMKYYGGDL